MSAGEIAGIATGAFALVTAFINLKASTASRDTASKFESVASQSANSLDSSVQIFREELAGQREIISELIKRG